MVMTKMLDNSTKYLMNQEGIPKIWLPTAEMGLGHLRAAEPLKVFADDGLILAGEEGVAGVKEQKQWRSFRRTYERISRLRRLPLVGLFLYSLMEQVLNISPYYPFRDLSRPSLQVNYLTRLIKNGMGEVLAAKLQAEPRPVVTTFYALALALEKLTDLPIYCVICDADLNRVWVSEDPKNSRIKYFAPCSHARQRLRAYGVPDERIFITGLPLPLENIGGPDLAVLRKDLARRLFTLDYDGRFALVHGTEARHYLGEQDKPERPQPPRFTLAIGGAGAQTEIAADLLRGLKEQIRKDRIHLTLVCGVRPEVRDFFHSLLRKEGMEELLGERVEIFYAQDYSSYFSGFSRILSATDILWTKPSELSFYCSLGIPMIIAPPIGPHEVYNSQWIQEIGAGLPQQEAKYAGEWLFDLLVEGRLTRMAWNGFMYGRKLGVYKIIEVLRTGAMVREVHPLRR